MSVWRHLQILALALFVGGAAAQDFPFKNGPLDPSLHSNKIFYNVTDVSDIQGVWNGVTDLAVPNLTKLWAGAIPLEEICSELAKEGILYSQLETNPLTTLVLPPENDGEIAKVMDMFVHGSNLEWNAVDYAEGLMRMTDDSCLIWKPYFDWEVGQSMFLRNRRIYLWFENGQLQISDRQFCVKGDVDHPRCSRQSFLIDGQEKDGVILDTVAFFQCTAGPCLELPFSLPGYVKTQGWQPRA